jgi:hypothetical protein
MRPPNATTAALVLLLGLTSCQQPSPSASTTTSPDRAGAEERAPAHEDAEVDAPVAEAPGDLEPSLAPSVPRGPKGLPLKVGQIVDLQTAEQPPGFPAQDEFADSTEACNALVPRLVAREDLRKPVLAWCLSRVYHSSRNGKVRSRLDGSQIHDRDRPSARNFYRRGLKAGYLDPKVCSHHVVDDTAKQPRKTRQFVDRWPYGTHCDYSRGACSPSKPGHMGAAKAKRWLKNSPDYERFGTRGPTDHNFWGVTKYLGGCFAPEALDRHDVSTATTILRSVDLCERLERTVDTRAERQAMKANGLPTKCRHRRDIRTLWHPRFWYETLRVVLKPAAR